MEHGTGQRAQVKRKLKIKVKLNKTESYPIWVAIFLMKIQKIYIYDVLFLFFETFSEQHFETLSEIKNFMSIRTNSIFSAQSSRAGVHDWPY